MPLDLNLLIPIWIVLGIVTALVGARKADPDERMARFALYFVIGVVLGPLGLILAAVDSGGRKTCPSCREPVSGKAVVCPHCQREMPAS